MPYICSIILVLNSFDVRIGKEDILFKKGSAVLIDYNLKDFFSSNIDHVMIVDVEEKTVNDFFVWYVADTFQTIVTTWASN